MLGLPCVVQGARDGRQRRLPLALRPPFLRATLRGARFAVGVSRPMVEELVRLGAPEDRAVLVPNGVDRALFHPQDRAEARRALGLPEADRIVLYVGRLEREKGLLDSATPSRRCEPR